eukprot:UN13245
MATPSKYLTKLFDLSGKTAVVTGGAQGIGLAIAQGLARAGANVALADLNFAEANKQSELLNNELKRRCSIAIQANVCKMKDIDFMIATTVKEFGSLDIAVNNAGISISSEDNYAESAVTESDYDKQMNLNVKAVFFCCQKEAAYMIKNKIKGKIINTASMSATVVNWPQRQAVYNLSKAAVAHMTRSLAVEMAEHGICVNSINPGYTLTPMVKQPGL